MDGGSADDFQRTLPVLGKDKINHLSEVSLGSVGGRTMDGYRGVDC